MTVAPAPSDAALVARLRSRDRTAWEDVYQLYGDRLYKFAYHLTGNPHDAADLVQETFVRVLPRLESLDPDTLDLGAYLFATERNLFLKSIELAKRQQPVDEIPEPTGPRPLEDDPQRSTLLVDQQERVRRANAALAPRQRLVLALRELEDRSYAEIGELVGLKENAVAQLISRARLRLREELRLVEVDRSKLPEECQALLPLLSSYLDGQLKGVAAERTIAHIESCEYCQKALTEMREASRLYRALIPIPFPELFERIDQALGAYGFWEPTSSTFRALARSKAAWLAAAGVVAIIASVVLLGALLPTDEAEPAAAQVDTTPPQLVLPASTVRQEATSPSGAPVAYAVSAEDAVSGSVEVSCSPAVGEVVPLGMTDVTCSAQDEAGNSAEGSFTVEVVDTTAPILTTPGSLQVEAQGPEGAPVAYRARARDRVDTSLALRCSPARGARWKPFQVTSTEVFPLGKTTVECTARDGAGNVARRRFSVTVSDSKAPVLALPDALSVEAGAPVAYHASARDAVDGEVTVECSVPAGRKLPVGRTNVACTSTDAAGNIARASFVVRVGDTTAPTLRLPDDLTVEATGRRTRVVFQGSADGAGRVQCRPASRSLFPLGPTTVRCSASDAQGNTTRGSFLVRVVDTTAPQVVVPQPLTVEATGPTGAKVEFVSSAKDLADRRPRVTCSPASGSTFLLGATTVRCTARDASGNRAVATFTATVVDTTAPSLTLPADRTLQATSTKGATVTYAASATDSVDGPLTPTCAPASGSVFPVGSTAVTCTARDAHGNERSGSFTITVTPFPQPDLVVSSVSGTSFTVTNRGNAAAGLFRVTVQGVGTFTIRGLAAGASVTRTVTCASIQRTITVDSQNQVAESNETNNTARIPPC